ncbi:MAG: GNAT family N-acetyltransferase [Spirochaetales bacterium]|nr:GNAT family N-acetyltransferase [Spirochaetales bacterium]
MSVTIYHLKKGDDHPSYLLHCQAIRRVVFVEGQGVPEAIDFDGQDGSSGHLLLFDKNIPVGTTRIRRTDKGMKLERIAVLARLPQKRLRRAPRESGLEQSHRNDLHQRPGGKPRVLRTPRVHPGRQNDLS